MSLSFRNEIKRPITGLLVLFLVCASFPKIIGDPKRLDAILLKLNDRISEKGIDVVAGSTSKWNFTGKNTAPRVALLTGMPVQKGAKEDADWIEDFKSGAIGFIGGAQPASDAESPKALAANADEFFAQWDITPKEKRIFLSFTRADAEHAHKVAMALKEEGYVTFVFFREGDADPPFDPALVGNKFSEAGNFLVLDSQNARNSIGVGLEAKMAKAIEAERRSMKTPGMKAFLKGIDGWVVTENPDEPGKLFVHRSSEGGMLRDMLYLIKVDKDGSWSIHEASQGYGGTAYGVRVGKISKPPSVSITQCSCH